ncbi:ParA family protein [Methylobacterium sp. SD274]|uniref:ParA family protein n=1 Tax=Methylobacterium sp. SD274 TaxID=2782009 RepID=UPI001A97B6CB|nr:ParA family protein [Methylobacterium sp. SD274]MBO1022830.1 ParA family protein [Methylobacterium sp. SD274]
MPVIAFVSQKGGVGKSTLARALAREAVAGGLSVLVGDLDVQQLTTLRWSARRQAAGLEPAVPVQAFDTVSAAFEAEEGVDLLVLDGPAKASAETLEIAQRAALVVIPSNPGADDLEPTVLLLHELVGEGIPKERLAVALVRVATDAEEVAARAYVEAAGYAVLPGAIAERAAYRAAQSGGASLTEVRFSGLAEKAELLVQAIIDRATV